MNLTTPFRARFYDSSSRLPNSRLPTSRSNINQREVQSREQTLAKLERKKGEGWKKGERIEKKNLSSEDGSRITPTYPSSVFSTSFPDTVATLGPTDVNRRSSLHFRGVFRPATGVNSRKFVRGGAGREKWRSARNEGERIVNNAAGLNGDRRRGGQESPFPRLCRIRVGQIYSIARVVHATCRALPRDEYAR